MYLQIPEGLSSESVAKLTIQIIKLREKYCKSEKSKRILKDATKILLCCDDTLIFDFEDEYTQTDSLLEQNQNLLEREKVDEQQSTNHQEVLSSVSTTKVTMCHPKSLSQILYNGKILKKNKTKADKKGSFYRKTRKCISCGLSYKRRCWTAWQNRIRRNYRKYGTYYYTDQRKSLKECAKKLSNDIKNQIKYETDLPEDQKVISSDTICDNIQNYIQSKQPVPSSYLIQSNEIGINSVSSKEVQTEACPYFKQWDETDNKPILESTDHISQQKPNVEVNQEKLSRKPHECSSLHFPEESSHNEYDIELTKKIDEAQNDGLDGNQMIENESEYGKCDETKAIEDSSPLQTRKDDSSSEEETGPLNSLGLYLNLQKTVNELIILKKGDSKKELEQSEKLPKPNQYKDMKQNLRLTENGTEIIAAETQERNFARDDKTATHIKPLESIEEINPIYGNFKEEQNIEMQQGNMNSDVQNNTRPVKKNCYMLRPRERKKMCSIVIQNCNDMIPESGEDFSKSRKNHNYRSNSPCQCEISNYSKEKRAFLSACFRRTETSLDTNSITEQSKEINSMTTAKARKKRAHSVLEDPESIKKQSHYSHVYNQEFSSENDNNETPESEDTYEKVKKCAVQKLSSINICGTSENIRKHEHENGPKRQRGRPRKSSFDLSGVNDTEIEDFSKSRKNHNCRSNSPCQCEISNYSKEKRAFLAACFRRTETSLDTNSITEQSKEINSMTTAKARKKRAHSVLEDPESIKKQYHYSHVYNQEFSSENDNNETPESEDTYEKVKKCAVQKLSSINICGTSENIRKHEHENGPKRQRGRPRKSSFDLSGVNDTEIQEEINEEQNFIRTSSTEDNPSSCTFCRDGHESKNISVSLPESKHQNSQDVDNRSKSDLPNINETPLYVRLRKERAKERKKQLLARFNENENRYNKHGNAQSKDVDISSARKCNKMLASRKNLKNLGNDTGEIKYRSVPSKISFVGEQIAEDVNVQTHPALNRELSVGQRGTVKVPNRNRKQIVIDNVSLFKRSDANAKVDSAKQITTKEQGSVDISCNQKAETEVKSISKVTNETDVESSLRENETESTELSCSHQLSEVQKRGEINSCELKANDNANAISLKNTTVIENKAKNICDLSKENRDHQQKNASVREETTTCGVIDLSLSSDEDVSSKIMEKQNDVAQIGDKAANLTVKPKVMDKKVISAAAEKTGVSVTRSQNSEKNLGASVTAEEKESHEVQVQMEVASQNEKQNADRSDSDHVSSTCRSTAGVSISKNGREKQIITEQYATGALSKSKQQAGERLTLIDKCNSSSCPLFTLTHKKDQGNEVEVKNNKGDSVLQIQKSNITENQKQINTSFFSPQQQIGEPTFYAQYNQWQPAVTIPNANAYVGAGFQSIQPSFVPPGWHYMSQYLNYNAFPYAESANHLMLQNQLLPGNSSLVNPSECFRDPRLRKYLPYSQQSGQSMSIPNDFIASEQSTPFELVTDPMKLQPHNIVASDADIESLPEVDTNKENLRQSENLQIKNDMCGERRNKPHRRSVDRKRYNLSPYTSSHISRHKLKKTKKRTKIRVVERKWKMIKILMNDKKPCGKISFSKQLGLFGFHGRKLVRGRFSFPCVIPLSPKKDAKFFSDPRLNSEETSINTVLLDILTACIDGKETAENIASHLQKLEELLPNLSSDKLVDFINMNNSDLFLMYSSNQAELLTALRNYMTKQEELDSTEKNISGGPEKIRTNKEYLPSELPLSASKGVVEECAAKRLTSDSRKSDVEIDHHEKADTESVFESKEKSNDIHKCVEQNSSPNGDNVSAIVKATNPHNVAANNSEIVGELQDVTSQNSTMNQESVLEKQQRPDAKIADIEILKQVIHKIPDMLKLLNLSAPDVSPKENSNDSSVTVKPKEVPATGNQETVVTSRGKVIVDTRYRESKRSRLRHDNSAKKARRKWSSPIKCADKKGNNLLTSSRAVVVKPNNKRNESLQLVHAFESTVMEKPLAKNWTISVNASKEKESDNDELVNVSIKSTENCDQFSLMNVSINDGSSENNLQTAISNENNNQLPLCNSLINATAPAVYNNSVSHYQIQSVVYPQFPGYSYFPPNQSTCHQSQLGPINNPLPTLESIPFLANIDFSVPPPPLHLPPLPENYATQKTQLPPEMSSTNPLFPVMKLPPPDPPLPLEKYPSPPPLPDEYPSNKSLPSPTDHILPSATDHVLEPPTENLPQPPLPLEYPLPPPPPLPPGTPPLDVISLPATMTSIPSTETDSISGPAMEPTIEKSKKQPVFIKPTLNQKCSHKCKHGKRKKSRRHRNHNYPIPDTPSSPPAEYTPPRPSTPTHLKNADASALTSKVNKDLVSLLLFLNLLPASASEKSRLKLIQGDLESNFSTTLGEILRKLKCGKLISSRSLFKADNTNTKSSIVPQSNVSSSVLASVTISDSLIPEKLNDTFLLHEEKIRQNDTSKKSCVSPSKETRRQNQIHSPVYTSDLFVPRMQTEVDNVACTPTTVDEETTKACSKMLPITYPLHAMRRMTSWFSETPREEEKVKEPKSSTKA